MKGWKNALSGLLILVLAAGLAFRSDQTAQAARDALSLCHRIIIPSLFPFFVVSSLAVSLGHAARLGRLLSPLMRPLFHVGGAGGAALSVGLLAGYPVGAATVGELYKSGSLTREDAQRLLGYCNNCGPAFLMGAAGCGVFGSPGIGVLLLASHWLGAVSVGLLLRQRRPADTQTASRLEIRCISFPRAFTGAVKSALTATLSVCAYVVLFSVVLALLRLWGVLGLLSAVLTGIGCPVGDAVAAGLLEMSSGITALTAGPLIPRLTAAAFLMGFGGLSVLCQTMAVLDGSGLSLRWAVVGKLLHGILAALWCRVLLVFVPQAVLTFAPMSGAGGAALTFAALPALCWGMVGAAAVLFFAGRNPTG